MGAGSDYLSSGGTRDMLFALLEATRKGRQDQAKRIAQQQLKAEEWTRKQEENAKKSGAMSGAISGAMLGSRLGAAGGPIGMAAGALAGGVGGGLLGYNMGGPATAALPAAAALASQEFGRGKTTGMGMDFLKNQSSDSFQLSPQESSYITEANYENQNAPDLSKSEFLLSKEESEQIPKYGGGVSGTYKPMDYSLPEKNEQEDWMKYLSPPRP